VVPGGGVDKRRRQWKKKKGKYLFNKKAMAKVFRARFLKALNEAGFSIPKRAPKEWVADCTHVGKGISALKYLSRYLYRGVISEKNIVSNQNGQVTFKYIESKTGNTLYRTLKETSEGSSLLLTLINFKQGSTVDLTPFLTPNFLPPYLIFIPFQRPLWIKISSSGIKCE